MISGGLWTKSFNMCGNDLTAYIVQQKPSETIQKFAHFNLLLVNSSMCTNVTAHYVTHPWDLKVAGTALDVNVEVVP